MKSKALASVSRGEKRQPTSTGYVESLNINMPLSFPKAHKKPEEILPRLISETERVSYLT